VPVAMNSYCANPVPNSIGSGLIDVFVGAV
jgi:hypothetical protein